MVLPVWILTLCSLEVNWSLTVNICPFSISLLLGSLVSTRCVGFPHARDCNARTSSRSGISVSCWISYQKTAFYIAIIITTTTDNNQGRIRTATVTYSRTSKVHFSLLLKSMRIVIWKVDTCSMCFRVLEPVTCAPPTPTSDPSSYRDTEQNTTHRAYS